jgi:hypothetical protein
MTKSIPLGDVGHPQHLRAIVKDETNLIDQVMDVYTGWIGVGIEETHNNLFREQILSFVPLSPGKVQEYRDVDATGRRVTSAIVVATISSIAGDIETAAVDFATVSLQPFQFPGVAGTHFLLVLQATVAAQDGTVHGIAYQVTVLTDAIRLPRTLTLDRDTTP